MPYDGRMKQFMLIFVVCGVMAVARGEEPAAETKAETPAAAGDLGRFKSADELWAHIQVLDRGPDFAGVGRDEIDQVIGRFLKEYDAALTQFLTRYPDDARRWDARLLRAQVVSVQHRLEGREGESAVAGQVLQGIIDDKDAPSEIKAGARFQLIDTHARRLTPDSSKEEFVAVERRVAEFLKEHPGDERQALMQYLQIQLTDQIDPEKVEPLLQKAANSDHPELVAEAKRRLRVLELKKEPLELKFTAVDGRQVDLEKLRGKVVLIDFWASWCMPCIVDLPNIIAAYDRYQERGFEVIGISLDRSKDELLALSQEAKIKWPQYFDGKGWESELTRRFGVIALPTQWLVDKKGYLRTTEVYGNLNAEIEKLLAE
jgi:thiol-disulfide isomerase/thioredoxin